MLERQEPGLGKRGAKGFPFFEAPLWKQDLQVGEREASAVRDALQNRGWGYARGKLA